MRETYYRNRGKVKSKCFEA